ncbi:MAG: HEAT repeat domain-containing protein [Leptolyngbya sp. PLA3]|nr:MAG: HEAT repeat domain-containing protein [Cyanobacteria bacterium CYA]MCE7968389.1 HEAT repeat domain-containing protein [Leptolyngbya sp. PL-A3]
MRNWASWMKAGLCVVVGVSGGCATTGSTAGAGRGRATVTPVETTLAYSDPVARSQLRERALDELMKAAASDWALERANAIEGLLEAPSRVEAIAAAGLKDENEGVRSVAAMVVGRARLSTLGASVRPLLQDTSPYVRASAIFALTRLGESPDRTPLSDLLFDDRSTRRRAHAAFILGELGDPSALAMLSEAARQKTPGATLVEQRLLELQIAEAMVKLGERAQLDAIRAALLPSSPEMLEPAALAAQIIGTLQDRESIDRLINLSAYRGQQGTEPPAEVMLAVAGSLSALGVPDGTFVADKYSGSEQDAVRAQAAFVYGQIGRVDNLGKLDHLLGDKSGLTRVSAATAVLKILRQETASAGL